MGKETQDRDDNPFKLSPRYRNKMPVVRREKVNCASFFGLYAQCLSSYEFDPSKCAEELRQIEQCKREAKITRRASSFNYHLNLLIKNKYRILIP
ncbi:putative mitochondrial protein [Tieghemostelium lacteum]|uniref:Putative mitochondrial protein n=1 Tax=Tieghemostelium lacteum TaxID=361077 RepID=A0A151ZEM4_TIELA|nr:putative mitochondrial protein [Tieghemostelium lacteum]|eukprot:KYQ92369.1 putative mitochondrial protein [Tieghemostelium lacteum]